MQTLENSIADRVKALRTSLKLTQEEVAGRMGRSVFTVSQIERGVSLPRVDTLVDFAAVFECDLADLVFEPKTSNNVGKSAEHRAIEQEIWAEVIFMDIKTVRACLGAIRAIKSAQ